MKPAAPLAMLVKTWPKLSETFILEEVLGLERAGVALRLYALAPPTDEIRHPVVATVRAPLVTVPPPGPARHARAIWLRHLRRGRGRALALRARTGAGAWRGARGVTSCAAAGWRRNCARRRGASARALHLAPADSGRAAMAAMSGLPFSISAHAKDIYPRAGDLQRRLRAARFTVTCTEANRRALAALAPEARVQRMYHGIDHGLFHPGAAAASGMPLVLAWAGCAPRRAWTR
jgi:hypothetical protein